ncbi:MAG: carboxymuconolactone decarboxylase family protein [Proteobacteria bacterium]|nr:MAG: carboxymuconolactone decarboxylase family protein [Pseudomonadota bacterium]
MSTRLNHFQQSANHLSDLMKLSMNLKESAIELGLRDLVNIRASLLNGCAFCLDMHVKEAKIHGERELRVHHVSIWRESTLFTDRERAALEWTEVVTRLPSGGVPDKVYEDVRKQLSEKELSDLTYVIGTINMWNRLAISFQPVPGSSDRAFGLDKSGLN